MIPSHAAPHFTSRPDHRRRLVAGACAVAAFAALASSSADPFGALRTGKAQSAEVVSDIAVRPDVDALAAPEHYVLLDAWSGALPAPGLRHPEGIDISPSGRIYVAEAGNHRVSVWSISGDFVGAWGARGVGPGAFEAPEDVALDVERGRLYVADTGNGRIQVLDVTTGAAIAEWTDVGRPRGLAVGADGTVYAADADGHRIERFDPEGTRLGTIGGSPDGLPSAAIGRLDTPLGLHIDASGTLYVADHGNARVQWFDATGAPVGALELDNEGSAGGAPYDVGVDAAGTVHVAVERGILRFTGGRASAARSPLPPLREDFVPGVTRCGMQEIVPEADNHEGVRRLALRPGVGLVFTYAPQLRLFDRIVIHPERGFEDVIPSLACGDAAISARHLYDPHRLDMGEGAHHLFVLDQTEDVRVFGPDGRWYDTLHAWPNGGGMDLSSDRSVPYHVIGLGGNRAGVSSLACFLGCGPAWVDILDPIAMTRRDRLGDRIPDAGWWNTAIAVDTTIATLNTGYAQIVIRDGFPCGSPTGLPCTDRACNPRQTCDTAAARPIIGVVPLATARDVFRSFRDLAHDGRGRLWVLARDGGLLAIDRFGRDAGSVVLGGLGVQAAEALAVDIDGAFFVLTSDERVHKFGPDGTPLADWSIEDQAGPGRYLDIAVDDDGRVSIPDADGDRIVRFVPGPPPSPDPPTPPNTACAVRVDKRAAPERLPLGDTTEVTLAVDVTCPPAHAALDIVLVFDGSCQMSGRRLANARLAGNRLLEAIDLDADRVAVVTFTDEEGGARLVQPLSDDRAALTAALSGLRNECLPPFLAPDRGPEGRMSDGLRAGREALQSPHGRPSAGTVVVLFSPSIFDQGAIFAGPDHPDTPPVSDREHTLWEARRLWADGTRIYAFGVDAEIATFPDLAAESDPTIDSVPGQDRLIDSPPEQDPNIEAARGQPPRIASAPGADQRPSATPFATNTPFATPLTPTVVRPDATPTSTPDLRASHPADKGLLASIVRPPDGYTHSADSSVLPELYGELGRELADRPFLKLLVVEDEIPDDMRLVPGSVDPPAEMPSARLLRWTLSDIGPEGPPALTYRLEPLTTGLRPTNVRADADYVDGFGIAGNAIFPIPVVEVVGPTPSATATVEPTSTPRVILVTPTASPSAPPTDFPDPTATRRPTGTPGPIYLPWLERDVCVPKIRPVDVAILIDTSSSMNGAKIEAARRAARTFVSLLALPRDRAAIVTFDARAQRIQDLTDRLDLLDAAIDSVSTAVGTRIDRGLWEALETVAGVGRRPEADPIIVLLTDGQTEAGSEEDMYLTARLAADAGVTIYAIGLGADVSSTVLTQLAGARDRVYVAPSAAEVVSIYERIARAIPCR